MIRKKVTMISTSLLFGLLVACNNNNDNALDTANRDLPNGSEGIQQVGTGHLTIDQNSYSTTMSSEKFPHTKQIQQGEFKFYKANPGERHRQEGAPQPNATAPQQPAPQPQEQPKQEAPANPQEQPKQEAPAKPQEQEQQEPQNDQPAEGITAAETKVIELTNAERRKNGLSDLKADTSLSNVASKKSDDMKDNNYFSHTSPTYGSPFDMMRDFGVDYKTAGENIAQGQQSPEQVVQAWMNSEGHRKNILSGDFTHIGVGHTQDGNYWTQMFIGK